MLALLVDPGLRINHRSRMDARGLAGRALEQRGDTGKGNRRVIGQKHAGTGRQIGQLGANNDGTGLATRQLIGVPASCQKTDVAPTRVGERGHALNVVLPSPRTSRPKSLRHVVE